MKRRLQLRMQDRYVHKPGNLAKEQTLALKKGAPPGRCIIYGAPTVHQISKPQQKTNAVPKRCPDKSGIEITQVKIRSHIKVKDETAEL